MLDIFDILGPVMIGPSSSHTAGAARIGAMARTLLGAPPVKAAIHLYEDLGFTRVGTIPGGFCSILGNFEDMHIYYKDCFGAALPS